MDIKAFAALWIVFLVALFFVFSWNPAKADHNNIQILPGDTTVPPELGPFIHDHVILGLEMDTDTYLSYVQFVIDDGVPIDKMKLALKSAGCFILWNRMADFELQGTNITPDQFLVSAYRALEYTKLLVASSGGVVDRVESYMIPTLMAENQQISRAVIVQCAALDQAFFSDLPRFGVAGNPPADWEPPEFGPPTVPNQPKLPKEKTFDS